MTVLGRDGPFTQTTRRPACRVGRHRAGMSCNCRPARGSAAPAGAQEPLPPTPPQTPQPTAAAWLLAILPATSAARRGIAIQQPPQLIPLRRRVGRVLGHHRPLRPPEAGAAPARLAAWCIRRAPQAGHPEPVRSGARAGPGYPAAVLPLVSQSGQHRRISASLGGRACKAVPLKDRGFGGSERTEVDRKAVAEVAGALDRVRSAAPRRSALLERFQDERRARRGCHPS